MLFYTSKNGRVLLHKEVYQLVPELKKLSDDDVLYIIVSTDYFALFHQYSTKDRERRAKRWVFGKDSKSPLERPEIRSAVKAYNAIQYNAKNSTLIVFQNKRASFEMQLEQSEDPDHVLKLTKIIRELQKVIDELEYEITQSIQTKVVLKGDIELSLIEEMRENKLLSEMREKSLEDLKNISIENNLPESKTSDNVLK